jgi:DNA repair protein RAD50
MSSLDSLMIQGIRTFSPDKPQVIKFYPITLILGHNGAGKTTIIECLRYITSGEFPPNTYKGKTWIHDPSLMKKKVKCVRSQVKLKFNDVYKNCPVATKNVELVVSQDRSGNTKSSIRTVDFVIKVTDQKTGEVKSLVRYVA